MSFLIIFAFFFIAFVLFAAALSFSRYKQKPRSCCGSGCCEGREAEPSSGCCGGEAH